MPTAEQAFPIYNTEGVPSSGPAKPDKRIQRAWAKQTETAIADATTAANAASAVTSGLDNRIVALEDAQVGGVVSYATISDLPPADNGTTAYVYADPLGDVEDGNGVWVVVDGVWEWTRALPEKAIRETTRKADDTGEQVSDSLPSLFRFSQPVPGLVDLQGRPLLASQRTREPAPMVSISGTTLVGISGSGASVTLFDAGGTTIDQAISAYPCPRILWSRAGIGSKTAASVVNGAAIPDDPRILMIIPAYGQSLAQGYNSLSPFFFESAAYPNILMPKTAAATDERLGVVRMAATDYSYPSVAAADILGFAPFAAVTTTSEMGDVCQSSLGPLCAYITNHIEAEMGWAPRFCVVNMAVGSASITHLKEGGTTQEGMEPMVDLLAAIEGICDQAVARGWIPWGPAVIWNHGQGDSSVTDYYAQVTVDLIDPINTAIQSLTGQSAAPKWFAAQPSSAFAPGSETFLAHQKFHTEGDMTVVNPSFAYAIHANDYEGWAPDIVHFSATAQCKWASCLATAILKEVFGGSQEPSLLPTAAVRTGTQIDVTMSEAFSLDSSLSGALYGVRYFEVGGGQPATTNVTQINSTTLRVTTATAGSASPEDSFVDFGLPRTIDGWTEIGDSGSYSYRHGVLAQRRRDARAALIEQTQPIYALHSTIGITP